MEVQARLLRLQMDHDNADIEGFDDPVDTQPAQAPTAPAKQ